MKSKMPSKKPFKSSGNRASRPMTATTTAALAPSKMELVATTSPAKFVEDIVVGSPSPPKAPRVPSKPFPFLALPSELRLKVYAYFFEDVGDDVLDLGPGNFKRIHKKLALMRVCKLVHHEATHFFYGSQAFRLFPTYPGRYFKSRKPLLARLKPRQRECLTSLELRLGPGWNAPPKGWAVNDALGLADCVAVRKVSVFVECDPSDRVFQGFRCSDCFYEGFCRNLLADVLEGIPSVRVIEFDAWPSVKKSGAMMQGLLAVAVTWLDAEPGRRLISWGLERGWTDHDGDDSGAVVQDLSSQTRGDILVGA